MFYYKEAVMKNEIILLEVHTFKHQQTKNEPWNTQAMLAKVSTTIFDKLCDIFF